MYSFCLSISTSSGFLNMQQSATWASSWHIKGGDDDFFAKYDLCRGINP
jgi:hypothetical protein